MTSMDPKRINLQGSVNSMALYFFGFGDIHGTEACKFTGFGDIHGPKAHNFIGFGDIHGPIHVLDLVTSMAPKLTNV